MSTDLENITASFGLVRREFRDVHAVVSWLDHQVRRLVESAAIHRPADLVARYAACKLIPIKEKRTPEAIAKQHFAADRPGAPDRAQSCGDAGDDNGDRLGRRTRRRCRRRHRH